MPARRELAICLSLAILLFLRQIGFWTLPKNRYYFHWQRSDTLVLAAAVCVSALVFFVGARLVRRLWPTHADAVLRWITVIAVADIAVGFAASGKVEDQNAVLAVTWALVAAAGLYLASRPASRFVTKGAAVLASLAWLAPLSFAQMLFWKPWDVRPAVASTAPARVTADRPPVFLFVFDDWSYQRTHLGGDLLPGLDNLRDLAARSFDFTHAHSQGSGTTTSIPRLVFQRTGTLRIGNGTATWREGGMTARAPDVPSVFAGVGRRGYQTSIVGFYLPYRAILGDQVGHIVSYSHVPKGNTLAERMSIAAARNLNFLSDPLSQVLWAAWYARTYSDNWAWLNRELRGEVVRLIRGLTAGTFALIHLPLPHAPFVFGVDGSYQGPFTGKRMDGSPEDYQRHLRVVDKVLGEFLGEMEAAGVLDRALVIVTSDHSWKAEPDSALRRQPGAATWVPLLVKLPSQASAYRVMEPFCLGQLGALIARIVDGTLQEHNLRGALPGLPSRGSCGPMPGMAGE